MSDDAKKTTVPTDEMWRQWHIEVRVAFDDMAAVLEDQLRPPRERDLGPREALRLYHDARDKLTRLFAHADRWRDPASMLPR
jgi:hypothetical protein